MSPPSKKNCQSRRATFGAGLIGGQFCRMWWAQYDKCPCPYWEGFGKKGDLVALKDKVGSLLGKRWEELSVHQKVKLRWSDRLREERNEREVRRVWKQKMRLEEA